MASIPITSNGDEQIRARDDQMYHRGPQLPGLQDSASRGREVARRQTNRVLRGLSPANGVEDLPNVSVYKGIDDERLLELYQHADVLFLAVDKGDRQQCALGRHGMRMPVLSTQLPSVKAYASGGEAILVEDNNIEQFVDAILHLADNPLTVRSMAVEARKRAEELDWRNITPQYEAIYSELSGKS
jgi:glycosyltransferase involved in cell wall biosynthesis